MDSTLKRIKELIDLLNYHTELYDKGQTEISDTEWDKLYFELQNLENESGIYLPNSPTQSIHFEVKDGLTKVTHNHPMLSLGKTKDIDEVRSFLGNHNFIAMCKMDGLTCSLRYVDGKLVSAETRGDGIVGEDVLHNVLTIKNVPKRIPYNEAIIVDGEIICTYENFKKFQDEYQNPRNFAAGSIRLLDSNECATRDLSFVAWDLIKGLDNLTTLRERLTALNEQLGFTVVPWIDGSSWENNDLLVSKAKKLSYPIDGIVFKFDDVAYGNSLGATDHHLKNAIAFKFEDETFDTKLKYIAWTIGRTGVLTPVAVFDPVEIDFTVVERASLHNVSMMQELLGYPYKGEPLQIYKANQIIPQVMPVDDGRYETEKDLPPWEEKLFNFTECPYCGHPIEYQKSENGVVNAYCVHDYCPGKLEFKLDYICSRKALNIMNLSTEIIAELIDWGWLTTPADLFTLYLHRDEWVHKYGYGTRSVDRILNSIKEAETTTLDKFITALGIELIGPVVARNLCMIFKTYEDFRNACQNGYVFETLDGFGEAKANALRNFDFMEADMMYPFLTITNPQYEDIKTNKPLDGMTIVVTGSLNLFRNRDEFIQKVEELGGKVAGSVSKNTNYLVNNNIEAASSKNTKAKSLGIPIITEEDFYNQFMKV